MRPAEPQPVEGDGGHDRGATPSSRTQATGWPCCPAGLELEVGPQVGELGRRRSDPVATAPREVVERGAHQGVAGVAPLGDGGDDQARRGGGRQVLGGVDGHVGPAVEHRGLDLLGEHALAAQLVDGDVEPPVALRLHRDQLGLEARAPAAWTSATMRSACHSARADPCRDPEHGLSLDLEELAQGSHEAVAAGLPAASLRTTVGWCRSLATTLRVTASISSAWRSSSSAHARSAGGPARRPHVLGLARQRHDHRGDLAGRGGAQVALELLVEDGLGGRHLAPALGQARVGEGPQVVHVEPGDAGDLAHGHVDVAGHGDVDDEQRPVGPLGHHRDQVACSTMGAWRTGGGEQQVDLGQVLGELDQRHGPAADPLRPGPRPGCGCGWPPAPRPRRRRRAPRPCPRPCRRRRAAAPTCRRGRRAGPGPWPPPACDTEAMLRPMAGLGAGPLAGLEGVADQQVEHGAGGVLGAAAPRRP